ncbi:MAG: class I SAM-dependent methyltransferase [Anaerolineae bacterium]|nr:class I SAM-dependent methyltransferase [Anaerolineae bacterium]
MDAATDDLLWKHLRTVPAFRALLRAVEAQCYAGLPIVPPVLDLGCGDGHFASLAFEQPPDAGLDPWWGPLREARTRGAHRLLAQASGAHMPYPDGYFATVVSNSVLEHIPLPVLGHVLAETARVLRPGGRFYFCVPGPEFLPRLSLACLLDRMGLRPLGRLYRRFFHRVSRHYHYDGPAIWEQRLHAVGLTLERWWPYFSPRALAALEWGHYLGLPSLVCKKLTGRWILAPTRTNLWLTERLIRPIYRETLTGQPAAPAICLFFVAQKQCGADR